LGTDFAYHLDAGKSWLHTKGLFGRWNQLIFSSKLNKHCEEVHRFVDKVVMDRLCLPQKPTTECSRFVLLNELAKYSQDPLELRHETLQLLNAGRDTTGALLGWVFYHLARNERVFNKLREAIIHDFGRDRAGEISFQKLKSCEYLHHCIQEVLRIASVVPVNERVCIRDTTLPRGAGPDRMQPVFVPKGQRILIAHHAMQHREDIWGADVEEFKPERWERCRVGFEFMPFGAGARKCIGRKFLFPTLAGRALTDLLALEQFALTETAYVVVRFLQRFDKIESTDKPGPPLYHIVFSNRSGTGVQVRLHEAVL
jgi:cytochrome P450